MPNRLHLILGAAVSALILSASGKVAAQTSHGLTDQERARALTVEARVAAAHLATPAAGRERGIPGLAATAAGRAGTSVVVSILPVGSASTVARQGLASPAGTPAARRAVVTRYHYATGITTRTWIDLNSGKTLSVRTEVNYPTPLAPAELVEAKSLLRSKVPEIDKIARDAGDKLRYYHLVPVSNNPSAPRYGHRLVWLWIAKPVYTAKYLVDLSTKEVEKIS